MIGTLLEPATLSSLKNTTEVFQQFLTRIFKENSVEGTVIKEIMKKSLDLKSNILDAPIIDPGIVAIYREITGQYHTVVTLNAIFIYVAVSSIDWSKLPQVIASNKRILLADIDIVFLLLLIALNSIFISFYT